MILKPPTEERTGSAPTTPLDPIFQRKLYLNSIDWLHPVLPTTIPEKSSLSQQEASKIDGQPRFRPQFSEK